MAFRLGHEFGGAVQALLGLDHLAGSEADPGRALVRAEFDQLGRAPHRADDGVELLDAIAVPVREHRQRVACRVKVDCWWVIASNATEGSAMIRAPLLRAISRCMSARSAASIPSPSIR